MNTRSRAADFMDTSIETTVTSISPPPRNRKAVSLADKYALSNEHHEAAKRNSLTLQEDGTAQSHSCHPRISKTKSKPRQTQFKERCYK